MAYIHKKEKNVIIPKALFNGHWNSEKESLSLASGDNNVHYLPTQTTQKKEDAREVASDKRYGFGIAAALLIVLGGTLVFNTEDVDRGLASLVPPEQPEYQPKKDQEIVQKLRSGERNLQSLGAKNLELKDRLEYEELRAYYVSFNDYDQVVAVELKPEVEPFYIPNYQKFFQKYEPFFSSLHSVQKKNEKQDGELKTLTFQSDRSLLVVQEDLQGNMISLNIEEM